MAARLFSRSWSLAWRLRGDRDRPRNRRKPTFAWRCRLRQGQDGWEAGDLFCFTVSIGSAFSKSCSTPTVINSGACNRVIMIRRARSAERAVEAAKRRFERLCHLADWRLYADGVELEDQLGLSAQHVSRNERGSAAGAPPARRSKAPAGKLRAGIGGTSSMSGD
jgi:hypothetical protein